MRKRAKSRETNELQDNKDKVKQLKQRFETPTAESSGFIDRFNEIHQQ